MAVCSIGSMLAQVMCPQAKEQASEWIDRASFACQGFAGGDIRHLSGLSAQEEFEWKAFRWISRREGLPRERMFRIPSAIA